MPGPLGAPGGGGGLPSHWEDQSYFSEPEFDSEYQHQHIHKSKVGIHSSYCQLKPKWIGKNPVRSLINRRYH